VRDTVLEMGVRGRDNGFMEEPSSFVEKRLYCQGCFHPVRGKAYFLRVSRWASARNKGLPALVKMPPLYSGTGSSMKAARPQSGFMALVRNIP
jgi:hypothetical protein